jgi:hypothetical protein
MDAPDDGYRGEFVLDDAVRYFTCMASGLILSLGNDVFHGFRNGIGAGAHNVMRPCGSGNAIHCQSRGAARALCKAPRPARVHDTQNVLRNGTSYSVAGFDTAPQPRISPLPEPPRA